MNDPLKPGLTTLIKLGSIVIHTEEALSKKGHEFDIIALKQLLASREVKDWLKAMDGMALIPKKRN